MVITSTHLDLLDAQTAERTGHCVIDTAMALSLVPPVTDPTSLSFVPTPALPPSPRNLRVYRGKLFLLVRFRRRSS